MIRRYLVQASFRLPVLVGAFSFLSAGAWVQFGLGAGLASIGLSLIVVEEVTS